MPAAAPRPTPGWRDLTTRTDGVDDTGAVDLGYHFPDHTDDAEVHADGRGRRRSRHDQPDVRHVLRRHGRGDQGAPRSPAGESPSGPGPADDASSKKRQHRDHRARPARHRPVRAAQDHRGRQHGRVHDDSARHRRGEGRRRGRSCPAGVYQPVATTASSTPSSYIRIHDKNITLTGTQSGRSERRRQHDAAPVPDSRLVNVGPETVIDGLTIGDVNWVGANGDATATSS